jgi:hypothetical protein
MLIVLVWIGETMVSRSRPSICSHAGALWNGAAFYHADRGGLKSRMKRLAGACRRNA